MRRVGRSELSILYAFVVIVLGANPMPLGAQVKSQEPAESMGTVSVFVNSLNGIGGGGLAVDALGNVYVSDFGETLWKISPDGKARIFATGFYGAAGTAVDSRGNLYETNFFGNTISKVNRAGEVTTYVAEGLSGPVGIAIDTQDQLYVCNCRSQTIVKINSQKEVSTVASSLPYFGCPNGITLDTAGNLYVVGFNSSWVLKIDPKGQVRVFAGIPGAGNAHIVFVRGMLYVTSFRTHQIFSITPAGEVALFAGSGERGVSEGPARLAAFSHPDGIGANPQGDTLYVNSLLREQRWAESSPPAPRAISKISLTTLWTLLQSAFDRNGTDGVRATLRAYGNDPRFAAQYIEPWVNRMGYAFLWQKKRDAALAVFQFNAESYPSSSNVYDSLAEAYMESGRTEQAIQNYKKSLELNPGNENARLMLQRLAGK